MLFPGMPAGGARDHPPAKSFFPATATGRVDSARIQNLPGVRIGRCPDCCQMNQRNCASRSTRDGLVTGVKIVANVLEKHSRLAVEQCLGKRTAPDRKTGPVRKP